ncbi:hypothetical protein RCZAHN_8 [Rhodobacter phage RcZahn]|nr:hypothetical protein RCZAHN_8 [Rhodobacter phage RcZahn]
MAVTVRKKPATEFTVADDAVSDGRMIGLAGDVRKRLARMARRSAPITHEDGNRRFDGFVLQVVAREVVSVSRL